MIFTEQGNFGRTRHYWQNKAAFTEKGYTMAANILAWSHQKKSYYNTTREIHYN